MQTAGGGYTTDTSTTYSGGESVQASLPTPGAPSGTTGFVILLATGLFVFSQWDSGIGKIWDMIWNPVPQETISDINWKMILAGVIFVTAMGVLASIDVEMGYIMHLMIIAMWLVYIINPDPNQKDSPLKRVFSWLAKPSSVQSKSPTTDKGTFSAPQQPLKTVQL